ncbi:hypothetical protein [Hymenobacter baengnokdamensis]|uniref:hypothetical protein n=1 Tax=Hymenobacter baengnokdamensis TaxID=2615203 RepID=UPI001E2AE48B|nr:hypothetical protein [Hymenobacter baengnokdamensis]
MKILTVSTDPLYNRLATPSALDKWLSSYLQDERDLPFIYLSLKISATMLPLAVLLFVPTLRGQRGGACLGCFSA